ncbi:MAG: YraN family protein [Gammaproteobacteria bacterium]|nr:MAG: YraN family protein [Gammaproteobacteria bacterium]
MQNTSGEIAEQMAREYLVKNGIKVLDTNYRSRCGEIDIIAMDNDIIAFVEVRYRHSNAFGMAHETVGPAKRRRIIQTAQHYLQSNRKFSNHAARFDLLCLDGDLDQANFQWFKSAFMAS